MAYRRRESGRSYSSADAYRSLHNPGNTSVDARDSHPLPPVPVLAASSAHHSSSSEEETALTSARGRSSTPSPPGFERDESPLSPPRPFFLGAGRKNSTANSVDRRSWSSAGDSLDPASDSDAGTDREAPSAGLAGISARSMSMNVGAGASASATATSTGRRVRSNTAGSSHTQTSTGVVRPRNHHRRRSSDAPSSPSTATTSSHSHEANVNFAGVGAGAGVTSRQQQQQPNPFDTPAQTPVSPNSLSSRSSPPPGGERTQRDVRGAPPSAFPFLSHTGNPDPGTPLPLGGALARRPSHESFRRQSQQGLPLSPTTPGYVVTPGAGASGYTALRSSVEVAGEEDVGLSRPYAPFMGDGSANGDRQSWVSNNNVPQQGMGNSVYRNSAAAAMNGGSSTALSGEGGIPRNSSQPQIAMRAPFLSPSSRPTSSLWSPPSYPSLPTPGQPLTSQYPPSLTYLPGSSNPYLVPRKAKPPMPSSRLAEKLSVEDKPWIKVKDRRERCAWWLTFAVCWLGIAAAAVVIYFGWTGVMQLKPADLCMVLDEEFNSGSLDSSTWSKDIELGGFGNGEFQVTTDSDNNIFFQNGQLYILPTLTTDNGFTEDQVLGNTPATMDITSSCTVGKDTSSDASQQGNCTAASGGGQALPPVMSGRLNTRGKKSIQFGKIEVVAKLPQGDWLWPAIWMLPENDTYGQWPLSGEIDIMEARGNPQSYPAQGVNFVRSSLNYGVMDTLQTNLIGWWQEKRFTYAEGFHTYALEWTPDWMRFYVDSRLQAMMNIKITGKSGKSFFNRAGYPATARNNASEVVAVQNIWAEQSGTPAAPFDQKFYLILDLAAGGTSGWFPDNVGDKPWFDKSQDAMHDFAAAQSNWTATWPTNKDDLAFRIDSVKMWSLKQNGQCPS